MMQLDISKGKTARSEKTGHRRRSNVKGGKRIASMAVVVLAACYQWGIETGRVTHNPARGVKGFKTTRRERYLSEREVACFSEAIADIEREQPHMAVMADAVRLLMLTGCRKSEILTLEWAWVDWTKSCLRLPDSKTGAKVVPLADAAVSILKRRWEANRAEPDMRGHNSGERPEPKRRSPFVLPAMKGDGCYVGLGHHWEMVRVRANQVSRKRAQEAGDHPDDVAPLTNVRLHDLAAQLRKLCHRRRRVALHGRQGARPQAVAHDRNLRPPERRSDQTGREPHRVPRGGRNGRIDGRTSRPHGGP